MQTCKNEAPGFQSGTCFFCHNTNQPVCGSQINGPCIWRNIFWHKGSWIDLREKLVENTICIPHRISGETL